MVCDACCLEVLGVVFRATILLIGTQAFFVVSAFSVECCCLEMESLHACAFPTTPHLTCTARLNACLLLSYLLSWNFSAAFSFSLFSLFLPPALSFWSLRHSWREVYCACLSCLPLSHSRPFLFLSHDLDLIAIFCVCCTGGII